jgi:hypothetical protein
MPINTIEDNAGVLSFGIGHTAFEPKEKRHANFSINGGTFKAASRA